MPAILPEWLSKIDSEDVTFIKKFILASGSLKEMAAEYNVSYPTVRLRLDKLIQKIRLYEKVEQDPYISYIKQLVVDEQLEYDVAKKLIVAYQQQIEKKGE